MTTTYLPLSVQLVGGVHECRTDYYAVSERKESRAYAITAGFQHFEHDDFLIAVIDCDMLVRLDWMDEPRDWDAEEIADAAGQLNLTASISPPPATSPEVRTLIRDAIEDCLVDPDHRDADVETDALLREIAAVTP